MKTAFRFQRLIDCLPPARHFLRGLMVAGAVSGVMAATPSLSQDTRGQISLPDGAHLRLLGGFNGMQVFAEDGTWTAGRGRQGVGHVLVLLCGAGGGGAGMLDFPRPGGGGGAGATVLTTVPVEAGVTYNVTVGHGGDGGATPGVEGGPGGSTTFQPPQGGALAQVGGGAPGAYDAARTRGVGGAGGEGQAHADGGIVRPGGAAGGPFGPSGDPVSAQAPGDADELCETFAPDRKGRGGQGGRYQPIGDLIIPGEPGHAGWALLIW